MQQDRAVSAHRARSAARAAGDRDCGRRSGRHNRSRAPRTACRRSRSRGAYSSVRCGLVVEEARHALGDLLRRLAHRPDRARPETSARQIGRHGADRRGDRHVVVVQDDDQPRAERAGIVHRLIGHAGRHGTVADDATTTLLLSPCQIARHGHAEAGGDRGRGMGRAERIEVALGAPREAGEAAAPGAACGCGSRRPVRILCG